MSKSVYLFFGDEYRASVEALKKVEELVPQHDRAFGLEVIDARLDTVEEAIRAISLCIEAISTIGFLGSQKVVWLRDASFLTDNNIGKSPNVKKRVGDLMEIIKSGLPPGQKLVVSSPKVDKRHEFYKTMDQCGVITEFAGLEKTYKADQQAEETARTAFKDAGLSMGGESLKIFIERVGVDVRQIYNEVNKLAVYIGDRHDIQLKDVYAVTCASREMLSWDLADAFGSRDMVRALAVFRQLIYQGESPIGLIIGIERRIRDLLLYREGLDKGWIKESRKGALWKDLPPELDKIFSEEYINDPRKTHEYRAGILVQQAKHFKHEELERCHKAVIDAHVELVSSRVPQPMIIELLLVKLLS